MTYILSGLSRQERQALAAGRAEQVSRHLRASDIAVLAWREWERLPASGRPDWPIFSRDFRAAKAEAR